MRTFADIPVTVERLLGSGERDRVGVILLDAFGRRFLERHAEHPFLRRLEVTELSTQFPPTTTAHVTTMHTGRPVGEHRLYEWHVHEPALDAIITPLLFSFADDPERDTLRGVLDPAALLDGDTLYERLPVPSTVLQPAAFSPSTYDRVAARGARFAPYATLSEGVEAFWSALSEPGYAYLYWDQIDAMGHMYGPDSREFDAAALEALDTLERGLRETGALVLVTADHGQVADESLPRRLARRAVARAARPADPPPGGLAARRVPAHERARRGHRGARVTPRRRAGLPRVRPRGAGPPVGRRVRAAGARPHGVAAPLRRPHDELPRPPRRPAPRRDRDLGRGALLVDDELGPRPQPQHLARAS